MLPVQTSGGAAQPGVGPGGFVLDVDGVRGLAPKAATPKLLRGFPKGAPRLET